MSVPHFFRFRLGKRTIARLFMRASSKREKPRLATLGGLVVNNEQSDGKRVSCKSLYHHLDIIPNIILILHNTFPVRPNSSSPPPPDHPIMIMIVTTAMEINVEQQLICIVKFYTTKHRFEKRNPERA